MTEATMRTGMSAFLTGAASGIGRATALRLGREGYMVGLFDVDEDGLESTRQQVVATGGTPSDIYRRRDRSGHRGRRRVRTVNCCAVGARGQYSGCRYCGDDHRHHGRAMAACALGEPDGNVRRVSSRDSPPHRQRRGSGRQRGIRRWSGRSREPCCLLRVEGRGDRVDTRPGRRPCARRNSWRCAPAQCRPSGSTK